MAKDNTMPKVDNISTLNDAATLTTLASDVIDKIDQDKEALRIKQREIDALTNSLKNDVMQTTNSTTQTDELPNYRDRYKKGPSASEKMEKIKAFVELTKSSVDISKSLINISEKQHKILIDAYKLYKSNAPEGEGSTAAMTPAEIAKLVKNQRNKEN